MTPERKIFWAFLWLALALVGGKWAIGSARVVVFLVPVQQLEAPLQLAPDVDSPRAYRQRMHFRREGAPRGVVGSVTTPARGFAISSGRVNRSGSMPRSPEPCGEGSSS